MKQGTTTIELTTQIFLEDLKRMKRRGEGLKVSFTDSGRAKGRKGVVKINFLMPLPCEASRRKEVEEFFKHQWKHLRKLSIESEPELRFAKHQKYDGSGKFSCRLRFLCDKMPDLALKGNGVVVHEKKTTYIIP